MRWERNLFKESNTVKKYDIIYHNDDLYIIMNITDSTLDVYSLSNVNIGWCIFEGNGRTCIVCNLEECLNEILAKRSISMLMAQIKIGNNTSFCKLEPNKYRDKIKRWLVKSKLIGELCL